MSARLRVVVLVSVVVVVAIVVGVALFSRPLVRYRDYRTQHVQVDILHPPAPPPGTHAR